MAIKTKNYADCKSGSFCFSPVNGKGKVKNVFVLKLLANIRHKQFVGKATYVVDTACGGQKLTE